MGDIMNDQDLVPVMLEYYKGLIDEDGYRIQKDKLRQIGIDIVEYDKSNIPMMSYEDLENIISIVIK